MSQLSDEFKVRIEGHVKIIEYEDLEDVGNESKGRVVMDKRNAIHEENASILIARAIANRENGSIFTMHFGTGGATVDPLGNILFATPNTTGAADLNTPVYFEVVDDNQAAPAGNQMAVRHINGTLFSDVEIRAVIDKNEPFGQAAFDNIGVNLNDSSFVFDEIGLKTEDDLLITHVVFTPVEKTANRIFEIVYTLRIRIAT
jgi:hypothetical protein